MGKKWGWPNIPWPCELRSNYIPVPHRFLGRIKKKLNVKNVNALLTCFLVE
jgi:hypothetical protein